MNNKDNRLYSFYQVESIDGSYVINLYKIPSFKKKDKYIDKCFEDKTHNNKSYFKKRVLSDISTRSEALLLANELQKAYCDGMYKILVEI